MVSSLKGINFAEAAGERMRRRGLAVGGGGYEQGGDSPDISYAAAFGRNVRALYNTAISGR